MAWPLVLLATSHASKYEAAEEPAAEFAALKAMAGLYVSHARPAWNLVDLRGPVPADATEILLRVPVALFQTLYAMWLQTFPIAEPAPEAED